MLLKYPNLDAKDIARFRRILFPLVPSKIQFEKINENEGEAADFFESLHARSEAYLRQNLAFYKMRYGSVEQTHLLDQEDAILSEDDFDYLCKQAYWTIEEFNRVLTSQSDCSLCKEMKNHG